MEHVAGDNCNPIFHIIIYAWLLEHAQKEIPGNETSSSEFSTLRRPSFCILVSNQRKPVSVQCAGLVRLNSTNSLSKDHNNRLTVESLESLKYSDYRIVPYRICLKPESRVRVTQDHLRMNKLSNVNSTMVLSTSSSRRARCNTCRRKISENSRPTFYDCRFCTVVPASCIAS